MVKRKKKKDKGKNMIKKKIKETKKK